MENPNNEYCGICYPTRREMLAEQLLHFVTGGHPETKHLRELQSTHASTYLYALEDRGFFEGTYNELKTAQADALEILRNELGA